MFHTHRTSFPFEIIFRQCAVVDYQPLYLIHSWVQVEKRTLTNTTMRHLRSVVHWIIYNYITCIRSSVYSQSYIEWLATNFSSNHSQPVILSTIHNVQSIQSLTTSHAFSHSHPVPYSVIYNVSSFQSCTTIHLFICLQPIIHPIIHNHSTQSFTNNNPFNHSKSIIHSVIHTWSFIQSLTTNYLINFHNQLSIQSRKTNLLFQLQSIIYSITMNYIISHSQQIIHSVFHNQSSIQSFTTSHP